MRRAAFLLLALSPLAWASAPALANTSHAKHHLSLSSVTLGGGEASEAYYPYFTAQARGYYKAQGLSVTLLETTAAGSDLAAAIIGGAYNFAVVPAQATTVAVQGGGAIRAVMANGYGATDELAVNASVAATDGIPTTGLAAQTQHLKGSHLTIGISNTVSGSYLNLVAYLSKNGLTVSGPGSDVSFQTLGSAAVLVTALNSGKVQAIANDPPITVQPNSVTIQYGRAAPINKEVNFFLDVPSALIKAHPDTVQAFVNASVQGWQFSRTHASLSLKYATPYFVSAGITSPEEITYIVADQLALVTVSPAITRSGFTSLKGVVDLGSPTQLTLPMSGYVNDSFVDKAIAAQGLPVPKG